MANVEDVEGEGNVQGNGPPQFNDQPNFRTLREYLHPARQIHIYILRTLKRYVILLLIEHVPRKPFDLNCSHSL